MFLEECKCTVKEKWINQYINDDLEFSSDDSDEKILDNELIDG